ncbi:ABC transporter [Tolypocladium paradoxum]|uniref:ABC transporter n=1 Tax=Tolypocladium paradoxum TaxID=94208 RepID=A0A2S4KUY8_9HYPO|nr:ABC transporter [Tolypocladium paradoxum]
MCQQTRWSRHASRPWHWTAYISIWAPAWAFVPLRGLTLLLHIGIWSIKDEGGVEFTIRSQQASLDRATPLGCRADRRDPSSSGLEWLDSLIRLARSDYLPPVLGLLSVVWIAFRLLRDRRRARRDADAKPIGPRASLSFELAGHLSRAAALTCSSYAAKQHQTPQQRLNAILVGYIFLLGLIRVAVGSPSRRRLLLYQVNLLSAAALAILLSTEALPLIVIGARYEPSRGSLGAIVSLSAAVLLAASSPREWSHPLPSEQSARWLEVSPAPEETCSWLDYYFTFGRLTPLVWKGFRSNVTMADLPELPWYNSMDHLLAKMLDARAKKGKTFWTIVYFARAEIAATAFYAAVLFTSRLISPYSLYKLLDYLMDPDSAKLHPFTWVILMFAASMVQLVALQQHNLTLSRLSMRVKAALTAEMYQRALASRELEDDFLGGAPAGGPEGSPPTASGQLANLISSDVTMVTFAGQVIMVAVGVPITVVFALIGLYQIVGWTALVGLFIIIVCFPLPTWIVRSVGDKQMEAKNAQDARISLASEYLSAIRVIKYFAWEDAMKDYIAKVRAKEQKHLWRIDVLYVLMGEVTEFIPVLALLAIFALYVGVVKQPLTAPVAFTAVTLVKMIKTNLYLLGVISPRLTRASISLGRIDKFFDATTPLQSYPLGPLRVENATFQRNNKAPFRLQDISIDFVQGGLNVVTGPSGSGKTTLLLALLGEAICHEGQVTRPKDIAYASQTPWLQALSVRDNILFNRPYKADRYRDVIHASCLSVDLGELANGDQTEVGESGASLSGGQRARVALARALYSDAPVLLLDDIFSALDTKTALTLWNRVFCTEMLKGRTVVLVSQASWMFSQADLTISLASGEVKSIDQNLGVVRTAKTPSAVDVDEDGRQTDEAHDVGDNNDALATVDEVPKADASNSMAIDDEMAASGVKGRLMCECNMSSSREKMLADSKPVLNYMLYFGGPGMVFLTLFALVLLNAFMVATPWWLSYWVDAMSKDEVANVAFYLGVYVAINIASTLIHGLAILVFARGAWVAGRRLHDGLVSAVMDVSLSWYKITPVGRVLNRLSMDIDSLDQSLGHQLRGFLDELIRLLFQIGAVSSIFPIFLLPSAVATLVGFTCGQMYSSTAIIVQRLVAASQSPIFSQFSESLSGIAVIRAQSTTPAVFLGTLAHRLHSYAKAAAAHKDLDCWLQFRIDLVTSLVTVSVGVMAIDRVSALAAGLAGFSLTNARGLSSSILNMVGIMNDLDIELQSFHRVEEYCKLPPEESGDQKEQVAQYSHDVGRNIPPNWPRTGRVEYRNVTVRYDADGPDVLTNINLTFEAGKRVAIVGRTGSGKSTLLLSLLRLTTIVSGQILLDGVDITAMPRTRLRRAVSAIPQEASLFQGTVGFNLDPLGEISEADLTQALELCTSSSSFQHAAATSGEKLTLSSPVQSEGSNFSHGQRQMLSLCRTLARKSKLMLLDEATASMDLATDAGIQDVLRAELSNSAAQGRCLVTIAHRLRTIVDYDQVVVMGSGQVLEVDSPGALFKKKGVFYDMVVHSQEQDIASKLG